MTPREMRTLLKAALDSADDYIISSYMLSELYDEVPKDIDATVFTVEIHVFPEEKQKEIIEWLNRETT